MSSEFFSDYSDGAQSLLTAVFANKGSYTDPATGLNLANSDNVAVLYEQQPAAPMRQLHSATILPFSRPK